MTRPTPLSSTIFFAASGVFVLISEQYATLHEVVGEVIQNALDVGALEIHVLVDERRRFVSVQDNGRGASVAMFEKSLASVARSVKKQDADKYGRFGLGLLSPLGKCKEFTFTSCSKDEGIYRTWTFDSEDLLTNGNTDIPYSVRPDISYRYGGVQRKATKDVWWRTEVFIKGLHRDRHLIRFDVKEFVSEQLTRFHVKIISRNVVICIHHVDEHGKTVFEGPVEVTPFLGDPLPVFETESGQVKSTISLYQAPDQRVGVSKGKIYFGIAGDPFRISARDVLSFHGKDSMEKQLDSDVVAALKGGILEGEIIVSGVELHPTRNGFKLSESLDDLCVCVQTWYQTIGKSLIATVQESRVDTRHQELSAKILLAFEGALGKNPMLENIFKGFTRGSVGNGHTPLTEVGNQPNSLAATRGGPGTERTPRSEGEQPPRSVPTKELASHRPLLAAGPKGSPRKTVASRTNAGLTLSFKKLGHSSTPYEVVKNSAGLDVQINIRNSHFVKCESREPVCIRYCMSLLALAVMEHQLGTNSHLKAFIKEYIPLQVFFLTEGEGLAGMLDREKKKKSK